MNDLDPRMNGAVSIYDGDATDEFPVLKAFQQYIDAEQAKARKRILLLGAFFGFVLTVVIGVFVVLLIAANARNQTLNDRLVDYAMKDRERIAVAEKTKPQQDTAALQAISSELDKIRTALAEERKRAERMTEEADAQRSENKKQKTSEAFEIERLKLLLAAEKEKAALESEKKKQAELEAYRRQHYPELYERRSAVLERNSHKRDFQREAEEADQEIEDILKDIQPISYFDDDEEETKSRSKARKTLPQATKSDETVPAAKEEKKEDVAPSSGGVSIPDSIKDSSGNLWGIPRE